MSCPGHEELLAWLEAGQAAGDEIGAHVGDGCPDCALRLRELDELALAMGRSLPPPVPARLREATLSQLVAASQPGASGAFDRAAGALRRVREYMAELLLSGPAPAAALGLRGDGDGAHRVYLAGPFQVDVALVGAGSVMGQVSGEPDRMRELAGATCILFTSRFAAHAPLGGRGDFRFEHLGPARYALMIDGPDARLLLPDIDLRDETDRPA